MNIALLLLALAQWDPADIVPVDQRMRFRNPDGSCVQCAIAMAGVHHCDPNAESLLWPSEYGPPERGGAWPERVGRYAQSRGMRIWNITGPQTVQWIEWALSTGRYAAIAYDPAHFQTAVGMTADRQTFYVVDNNRPDVVQTQTRATFLRRHNPGVTGHWAVILQGPSPPPWVAPSVVAWWENLPQPKPKPDKPDRRPDLVNPQAKPGGLGFDRSLF